MSASRVPALLLLACAVALGWILQPFWGAILWAVIIAGAGWFFGAALEAVLTDIKKIEEALLLAILVAGVGIWLWHRRRATAKIDRAD